MRAHLFCPSLPGVDKAPKLVAFNAAVSRDAVRGAMVLTRGGLARVRTRCAADGLLMGNSSGIQRVMLATFVSLTLFRCCLGGLDRPLVHQHDTESPRDNQSPVKASQKVHS